MNITIFLACITLFCSAQSYTWRSHEESCDFSRGVERFNRYVSNGIWVECKLTDDQLALDQMLRNGTIPEVDNITRIPTGRRVNVSEIAPLVYFLKVGDYERHKPHQAQNLFHQNCSVPIMIRPGMLAKWTGLQHFEARGYTNATVLHVDADEFIGLPQLERLTLRGATASENTLQAIASVSDRLRCLNVSKLSPADKIVGAIANMTPLEKADIFELRPFPPSTLHNSASTLRSVILWECGLSTITPELLSGMRNLTNLHIHDCTTLHLCTTRSIDEVAFDDLDNLEEVFLDLRLVKRLPHGLFDKTKKLKKVHNGRSFENLSRANFTHGDDFENFKLFD